MAEELPPVVATLTGEIAQFEKAWARANELLSKFGTTVKRVQDRLPGLTAGLDDVDTMLKVLDERLTASTDRFLALDKAMAQTRAEATKTAAAVDKASTAGGAGTVVRSGRSAAAVGAEAEAATARVERLKSSLQGMAGAGQLVGLAVGFIGYESVKMAMSFDASMTKLHTQAHVSLSDVQALKGGVLDLAGQVGFSPDSLAEALYHIESNFASLGIKGPDALNMLKVAAQGAAVGHADLVDVTNALTAAVAAQIPGVENLQQAMGVLNATVGAGDMSMQDLADAFSTGMVATVKGYGLSIKDVGAALAVLGDNNMRGQVAATNFRMAVQAMARPVSTAGAALKQLGMTQNTLALDMQRGGLRGALNDLVDRMNKAGISAKEQGDIITEIFGRKAGTALNIFVAQLPRLNSKYGELDRGAKEFADSWSKTQDTFRQRWNELKGTFDSLAIRIGEGVLPVLGKLMGYLQDGVVWVTEHRVAVAALAGALGGLLVGALAAAVIAFGEFLGAAGGIAVAVGAGVGVLASFAGSLSGLARWVSENRQLILLLAVVIGQRFLPSLAAVQVAVNRFVVTPLVMGLVGIIDGTASATAGLKALRAAILSTETVATAGFAAAALGAYNMWQAFQGGHGKDMADQILSGFDPNKFDQAAGQVQKLAKAVQDAQAAVDTRSNADLSSIGSFSKDLWNLLSGSNNNVVSMTHNTEAMNQALSEARMKLDNVHENLVMLSMQTGISTDDLGALASTLGVDLSGSVSQSAPARQQILDDLKKLETQTGMSADALNAAAGNGVQAWKEFADAISKAQQATAQAFQRDTSVIASFNPQQSLKAQYDASLKLANQFVTDIGTALNRGLDPGIVSQLLQEGPKAAEPYLKAVLGGHGNTMIKMANDAETQLSKISAYTIEQAQLTQIAISSHNSQLALDFQKAAAISMKYIQSQGTATVQQVAKDLHMSEAEVQRIAGEFGIKLMNSVQAAADSHPVTVYGHAVVTTDYINNTRSVYNQQVPAAARGYGAEGAIVSRPTLALIGEAGPEALIPLNQMPGARPLPSGGSGSSSSGGDTVNHIVVTLDGDVVYRSVQRQSLRHQNRNGTNGLSRP